MKIISTIFESIENHNQYESLHRLIYEKSSLDDYYF